MAVFMCYAISIIQTVFQHTADIHGCVHVLCSQYDQDWCFSTQLIDVAVFVCYAVSMIKTGVSAHS